MIYWINFMLYLVSILESHILSVVLLTPKHAKVATVFLWTLLMLPTAGTKFFIPSGSEYDSLFACINMVVQILTGCVLFEEKIIGNILALCVSAGGNIAGCLAWIAVVGDIIIENDKWETVLGYAVANLTFLVYGIIFKTLWDFFRQKINVLDISTSVLLILAYIYYMMSLTYMLPGFYTQIQGQKPLIAYTVIFICLAAVYILALYMLIRKNEEQSQLKQLRELEIAWKSERANYDTLLSKMGQMERIRHDFYGQLAAARHIMTLDRERGSKMIEELMGKLLQEKENDILD